MGGADLEDRGCGVRLLGVWVSGYMWIVADREWMGGRKGRICAKICGKQVVICQICG